MPRNKYIYSVYDLNLKAHIGFFSSLNKAREFVLANDINAYDNNWYPDIYGYSGKQSSYSKYSSDNVYRSYGNYTHIYIRIELDKNGYHSTRRES